MLLPRHTSILTTRATRHREPRTCCVGRRTPGLSAWELACHASLTGALQVSHYLALSVSDRRVPVLTPRSGTQRARSCCRWLLFALGICNLHKALKEHLLAFDTQAQRRLLTINLYLEHEAVLCDPELPDREGPFQLQAKVVDELVGRRKVEAGAAGQRVDGRPAWVPEDTTDPGGHGSVTIEQRFAAVGVGVRTVGELIERLGKFDPTASVRVQHGLSSMPDFIIGVGKSPDVPGTVAIVYLPPPSQFAG